MIPVSPLWCTASSNLDPVAQAYQFFVDNNDIFQSHVMIKQKSTQKEFVLGTHGKSDFFSSEVERFPDSSVPAAGEINEITTPYRGNNLQAAALIDILDERKFGSRTRVYTTLPECFERMQTGRQAHKGNFKPLVLEKPFNLSQVQKPIKITCICVPGKAIKKVRLLW
jgi:hypothetical protein